MKVWLRAILGLGLLCAWVANARAEQKEPPNYDGRLLRLHEERTRKATADKLRFERARRRAQQRIDYELRCERMGYSPLRPYVSWQAMALGQYAVP